MSFCMFRIHYVCSNDSTKVRVIFADYPGSVPLTFDKATGYWIGGTELPNLTALRYRYALIDDTSGASDSEQGSWRCLVRRGTRKVTSVVDSWRPEGIPQRVLDAPALRGNLFASTGRRPGTAALIEQSSLQQKPCVHLIEKVRNLGLAPRSITDAAGILFRLIDPRINCAAAARVVVCGAVPQLGSWKPERALPMHLVCDECGCWEARAHIHEAQLAPAPVHWQAGSEGCLPDSDGTTPAAAAAVPLPWEYKYVIIADDHTDGHPALRHDGLCGSGVISESSAPSRVRWEDGANRTLDFALLPVLSATSRSASTLSKVAHPGAEDATAATDGVVQGLAARSQQPRQRRGSYADAVRRGSGSGSAGSSSCSAAGGEPVGLELHAPIPVAAADGDGTPASAAADHHDAPLRADHHDDDGPVYVPLIVVTDNHARLESPDNSWKGAGLSCPLSSLRCAGDAGIGDFTALHAAVRVAHASGFKALHLMPINDTGPSSNPFRALSSVALHPIYINLPAALAVAEGVAERSAEAAARSAVASSLLSLVRRPSGDSESTLGRTSSDDSLSSSDSSSRASGRDSAAAVSSRAGHLIQPALRKRILESSASGHSGVGNDSEAALAAAHEAAGGSGGRLPSNCSAPYSASSRTIGGSSDGAAFSLKGQSLSAPASAWPSAAALSAADSSGTPFHATRSSGSDPMRSAATGSSSRDTVTAALEADAVDWPPVLASKLSLLRELYAATGEAVLSSRDFGLFFRANREWLQPYALYCFFREVLGSPDPRDWGARANITQAAVQSLTDPGQPYYKAIAFHYWVQAVAHAQLADVAAYARSLGICLITDVAQSVAATSCDAWVWPHLFHASRSMAAPPSASSSREGRNLHVLPLNWASIAADGDHRWWRMRLNHDAAYFSGLRLARAHEYFAAYTVPAGSTTGLRGIFDPADGFTAQELLAALDGSKARERSTARARGGNVTGMASEDAPGARDASASTVPSTVAAAAFAHTTPPPAVVTGLNVDSLPLLRRLSEPYIREWTLRAALGPSFAAIAPRFLHLEVEDAASISAAGLGGAGGRYQLREGFRSEGEIKATLSGTPDEDLVAPLVQLLSNACLVPLGRSDARHGVSPLPRADGFNRASSSAYLQLPSSPTAATATSASIRIAASGEHDLLHNYSFHPRADMHSTTSFLELPADLRAALSRLHALHFSHRMHDLWRVTGYARLSAISRIAAEIGADVQHDCGGTAPAHAAEGNHHGPHDGTGRHESSSPSGAADSLELGAGSRASVRAPSSPPPPLAPLLLADDQHVRHPALRDVIRHVGLIGSDCHRSPPLSVSDHYDGSYGGAGGGAGPASLLPAAMAGGVGAAGDYGYSHGVAAGFHFLHPARMEWATAAAASWHDMPPLRQWWEDNTAAAWAYYRGFVAPHLAEVEAKLALAAASNKAARAAAAGAGAAVDSGSARGYSPASLSDAGRASSGGSGGGMGELPRQCTPDIAAAFFRHYAHGSAALLLCSAADWLSMDGRLRRPDAHERIDIPGHEHHEWRWRLPVPLEALAGAGGEDLRNKTRNMLADARRLGCL